MTLENEISRYAGNLVGGITATYSGTITISPAPKLNKEDGTSELLTEVGVILSPNKQEDYDSKIGAEEFSLSGGTSNIDGSATYTQVTRGIANNSVGLTPGGHINWQTSHQDGAPVIIDPTYKLRQLDEELRTNVATRFMQTFCFDATTDVSIGDGRVYLQVPSKFNGDAINVANATVITAGVTGDTAIQIHNLTNATDVLSTPITIPGGAYIGSGTIDGEAAEVLTGDILRIDIDSASTTAPKGLIVNIEFLN